MTNKHQIATFMESAREEVIDLTKRLIAAKTVNPPGDEASAAQVVEDYLRANGIPCERFEKAPGRTNVLARIGSGTPVLLVPLHLDTVPPGDGWTSDPFRAEVREGRIYGRGAGDDKGPLASCLVLMKFLKQHERDLKGQFLLAAAADEECGSGFGFEWLLVERKLCADYAIVPDVAHNMQMIDVAEKGVLFFEITSHGKQAHGSRPEKGVNAVWNMIDLLNRIRGLDLATEPHPLLGHATLNLGAIEGGSAPNMVPARCTAKIDIRYLPSQTKDGILGAVQRAIADTVASLGTAKFDLRILTDHPPTEVPTDHLLVKVIQRHAREMLDIDARPMGQSGATLCKQLLAHGIAAVGFAPGDAGEAHAANESISIQELVDFAKVMAAISLDLLGRER
ncbi:MAG: M20 family metallopeptidase [Planctomycetes bacterium]|nr:M20 family metallopeptidase [Planctomycetota bacterium]